MSIASKFERSLLSHEEYEIVRLSHHPAIYDLDDGRLRELRGRLRALRDKERTLVRQKRRETRGKAEPRGGSFPGLTERAMHRKQVFANAVKRVNHECSRIEALAARAALREAAQRALASRQASDQVHHPPAEDTAGAGMRQIPSERRRRLIAGSRIGAISQATKRAQAQKDARS
jgi:hypothetical protein